MKGILDFANIMAGTLSLQAFIVIVLRGVQFYRLNADLNTMIVPPTNGQTHTNFKNQRMILLIMVGCLLLSEFAIDYRTVIGRHFDAWEATQSLALACWIGKSVATLVLARQFSLKPCGEKGWISMLIIALVVSFFLI